MVSLEVQLYTISVRVVLQGYCSKMLSDAILHLIKEQCSTNRCQCREVGLKFSDLCSCNDAENDGSCDNDAGDNDREFKG